MELQINLSHRLWTRKSARVQGSHAHSETAVSDRCLRLSVVAIRPNR